MKHVQKFITHLLQGNSHVQLAHCDPILPINKFSDKHSWYLPNRCTSITDQVMISNLRAPDISGHTAVPALGLMRLTANIQEETLDKAQHIKCLKNKSFLTLAAVMLSSLSWAFRSEFISSSRRACHSETSRNINKHADKVTEKWRMRFISLPEKYQTRTHLAFRRLASRFSRCYWTWPYDWNTKTVSRLNLRHKSSCFY